VREWIWKWRLRRACAARERAFGLLTQCRGVTYGKIQQGAKSIEKLVADAERRAADVVTLLETGP
jgi:hypothetical protein